MIFYGLLAFFVLEYLRPATFVPALGALRLNALVPLGTSAWNLVGGGRISNQDVLAQTNTKVILVFLGLIGLSVVTADVGIYAFTRLQQVLGYVLIYWVMARRLDTAARFKAAFAVLIMVHVVLAALTPEMFTETGTRHYMAAGTFLSDGNDFALSVNVCIPLCLFLLLDSKRSWLKIVWTVVLAFLVACVLLTQSRGGTLALACMGLYYWFKSDRKLLMVPLAGLVVAGILAFAPAAYFERMNTIDPGESSARGRIFAWKAAARMAADRPLTGVGAGNFPFTYGAYRVAEDDGFNTQLTAHSIYFLALGELGVPGLAVLLFFIVHNLTSNRRLDRHVRSRNGPQAHTHVCLLASLDASLIAFATGGAFLSQIYTPHWYVIAGFLSAARIVVRAETSAGVEVTQLAEPRGQGKEAVDTRWRAARDRYVRDRVPRLRPRSRRH